MNGVLVEKYYNDPNLGRDAFGAVGDLAAGLAVGLLAAGLGWNVIPAMVAAFIAGELGKAAGKAAWDILTSKEWQDFTDPAKNKGWTFNPYGDALLSG